MKAIQALLGHASYSLTADTYTSLMPQFEKEAVDAPVGLVPRKGGEQADTPAAAEATSGAEPEETSPDAPDEGGVAVAEAPGRLPRLYLVKPDASGDNENRGQGVA